MSGCQPTWVSACGWKAIDRPYSSCTALPSWVTPVVFACHRQRDGAQFDAFGYGATEEQALVREFVEETGMAVRPFVRLAEAAQYFRKSDGAPVNNIAGFWIAEQLSLDPKAKVEADHELVWLHPHTALNELRHDAHAWAVSVWLRRHG